MTGELFLLENKANALLDGCSIGHVMQGRSSLFFFTYLYGICLSWVFGFTLMSSECFF